MSENVKVMTDASFESDVLESEDAGAGGLLGPLVRPLPPGGAALHVAWSCASLPAGHAHAQPGRLTSRFATSEYRAFVTVRDIR